MMLHNLKYKSLEGKFMQIFLTQAAIDASNPISTARSKTAKTPIARSLGNINGRDSRNFCLTAFAKNFVFGLGCLGALGDLGAFGFILPPILQLF